MEPEGSLQRSQEPSTALQPEPDQSSPYSPILSQIIQWVLNIPLQNNLVTLANVSASVQQKLLRLLSPNFHKRLLHLFCSVPYDKEILRHAREHLFYSYGSELVTASLIMFLPKSDTPLYRLLPFNLSALRPTSDHTNKF
jgi:hypothetical protein